MFKIIAAREAAERNGGKVIVQVERVSHAFSRPRNVIVPGILVDAVVVCENTADTGAYNPALSGDIHVPATHMDYFVNKLSTTKRKKANAGDQTADIIGERAARELYPGQIVNIGIGIPETVGIYASKQGILKDIHITVEAGGVGGLPAPGVAFGATIGADMICDMATQFDFYDGGGLDICFLGGLEADAQGNVNAHKLPGGYAGIGGFANITHATKTIVFCMSFTTKGLVALNEDGAFRPQDGITRSEIADMLRDLLRFLRVGRYIKYANGKYLDNYIFNHHGITFSINICIACRHAPQHNPRPPYGAVVCCAPYDTDHCLYLRSLPTALLA